MASKKVVKAPQLGKKSPKVKLIIALAVILMIATITGAMSYFLMSKQTSEDSEASSGSLTCGFVNNNCQIVTNPGRGNTSPGGGGDTSTSPNNGRGDTSVGKNVAPSSGMKGTSPSYGGGKDIGIDPIVPMSYTRFSVDGTKICVPFNDTSNKKYMVAPGRLNFKKLDTPNQKGAFNLGCKSYALQNPIDRKVIKNPGASMCSFCNNSCNNNVVSIFNKCDSSLPQTKICITEFNQNFKNVSDYKVNCLVKENITPDMKCGFCGNDCIDFVKNPNTACAAVKAPAGKACVPKDNTCQIVTKPTKTSCGFCGTECIDLAKNPKQACAAIQPVDQICTSVGNECVISYTAKPLNCGFCGSNCIDFAKNPAQDCAEIYPTDQTCTAMAGKCVAAPKKSAVKCGFCGTNCVDFSQKKTDACPEVMPPANQKCAAQKGNDGVEKCVASTTK